MCCWETWLHICSVCGSWSWIPGAPWFCTLFLRLGLEVNLQLTSWWHWLVREPLGFCYLSRAVIWCTLPTTDTGNWTQIFMHLPWALYQLSHSHSPWYFYFQFCLLNPWGEQDDDESKGGLRMQLRAGRHAWCAWGPSWESPALPSEYNIVIYFIIKSMKKTKETSQANLSQGDLLRPPKGSLAESLLKSELGNCPLRFCH